MEPVEQKNPIQKKSSHRLAGISSMVGTTIEWYDFFIYGAAAALVFNKLFFPNLDPLSGVLAAFATYAVGFIGRPLGGIVFGHYGDKIGRKSMLLLTLMLMGIPTVLIGLLPTYETIGYWAAFALVLLRFVQGMAMGGEWGGAVLMAVEHAPEGKKGFWGSLPQASTGGGLMLASIALWLVSLLPEPALFSWGWRLPFLASILLLGVGWYIRMRVPESPDFEKVKEKAKEVKIPAFRVLRDYPKPVLRIIVARAAENAWFYMASTFTLAYTTTQLGIPRADILFATICGAVVIMFMTPLFGHWSDKVGQRNMFMFGLIVLALYCYPFFIMLDSKDPVWVWTAIVLAIGVVFPLMYAPQAQLFSRQFPAEIRYSGISISVQFAGVLGGGLAPLIATKLLGVGGGNPYLISLYILGMTLIAIVCTSFMPRDRDVLQHKSLVEKESGDPVVPNNQLASKGTMNKPLVDDT